MKRKLFLIMSILFLGSSTFQKEPSTKLFVEITNIKHTPGKKISVGVFDKSTFPTIGKAKYEKSVVANSGTLTVGFDLPNGEYAVAIYHDLNANRTLDKNILGIPKEPYGFSKNFKPGISAPEFDDCSIILNGNQKNISISLIQ
jgi:uncharacterized protein (DUF2141 family)